MKGNPMTTVILGVDESKSSLQNEPKTRQNLGFSSGSISGGSKVSFSCCHSLFDFSVSHLCFNICSIKSTALLTCLCIAIGSYPAGGLLSRYLLYMSKSRNFLLVSKIAMSAGDSILSKSSRLQ